MVILFNSSLGSDFIRSFFCCDLIRLLNESRVEKVLMKFNRNVTTV